MSIAITILGQKLIKKHIKKLEQNLKNRTKLNKRIGEKALREIDKQFRTEGTNFNTPWKSLAESTIKARKKGAGSGAAKILRDTGRLAASITSQPDSKKVIVGSNLVYARNHQKGTTVIARPFLPEDKNLAFKKIAKPVIDNFMKNEIRKANKG